MPTEILYDARWLREASAALGFETVEAWFTRAFDYRYHDKGRRRRWLGETANIVFSVVCRRA